MSNNSAINWTDNILGRPEIFPHQIELLSDQVLLVNLSAEEVKDASFLDQRVLKPTTQGQWLPWSTLANAVEFNANTVYPHFIFHVGHCGSTLISRLLAFANNTQSLREPLALRTLAKDLSDGVDGRAYLTLNEWRHRLKVLLALWARAEKNSIIKATSICTGILPQVLTISPQSKALFIYNPLETHLTTLLAGQNAAQDLRGFGPLRVQRIQQNLKLNISHSELSLGQLAAVSWLSETYDAFQVYSSNRERIMLIQFDEFLKNPQEHLKRSFQFLDVEADKEVIDSAINSSVMQSYSKAPEHKYNAETRAIILQEAKTRFKNEIETAIKWMFELAESSEDLKAVLKLFS